jgi:hypothetical protein
MLTGDQIDAYWENGFLAVESVFTREEMAAGRAAVEELVERSRSVTEHNAEYDLEPGHTPVQPRVRRLKTPLASHPVFEKLARKLRLDDILELPPGRTSSCMLPLHGRRVTFTGP